MEVQKFGDSRPIEIAKHGESKNLEVTELCMWQESGDDRSLEVDEFWRSQNS